MFDADGRGDRHQRADPERVGNGRGRRLRRPDQRRQPLDGAADPDRARCATPGWASRRRRVTPTARRAVRPRRGRGARPSRRSPAGAPPTARAFAAETARTEFEGLPFCPGGDLIVAVDGKPVELGRGRRPGRQPAAPPGRRDPAHRPARRRARRADRRPRRPPGEPAEASLLGPLDSGAWRPARTRSSSGTTSTSCPGFDDGSFQLVYVDPPFNTGRPQRRLTLATDADADGDRIGFGGRRYATRVLGRVLVPRTRSTTTSASSSRACGRSAACSTRPGTLYLHLDYREAHYVQGAARRALRPRVLPQRDRLGLRLRRPAAAALAGEARHDPRLRQGSGPVLLRRRGGRARAVHGARARRRRRRRRAASCRPTSGGTRSSRRPGREKTGYPTQKPEGIAAPDRAGVHAAGRLVPRPLRRLGARSGRSARSSAAATSSSTRAPRRSRSRASGSRGLAGKPGYALVDAAAAGRQALDFDRSDAPAALSRVRNCERHGTSVVSLVIPAKAEYIALGRLALAGLLRPRAVEPEVLADVKLALTEACSNSIRHAYADGREGEVEIRYELADATARGRGLATRAAASTRRCSPATRTTSTRAVSASRSSGPSPTS